MAELKVGDKVRVLSGGDGVVTYGPVNGTTDRHKVYVVKQDGDEERAFPATHLEKEPTTFAVGDVVTLSARAGARATVEYGPIDNEPVYLVKLVSAPSGHGRSRTFTAFASAMTKVDDRPLVPVGTRVRVDRATWAEGYHGHTGAVTSNGEKFLADEGDRHSYRVHMDDGGNVYAAEVTPVTDESDESDGFEYEGVTYEYGTTYKDVDGELFKFDRALSSDGTPRGMWVTQQGRGIGGWLWSLSEVVRDFGPLTKRTP